MITISVESDEEQWAIGTALVNGAIGFGNWPYEIKRRYRAGPDGGGGYPASGANVGISGAAVSSGCAGGGASGPIASSGGSGVNVSPAAGRGGSGGTYIPDFFVCPLRTCCATSLTASHREGCDEDS